MSLRHGYRWTIPEILSLQREYELLHLSIPKIAEKHNRSENAIAAKIESENFQREIFDQSKIEKSYSTPLIASFLDDDMFFALVGFCTITFFTRMFTTMSLSESYFNLFDWDVLIATEG